MELSESAHLELEIWLKLVIDICVAQISHLHDRNKGSRMQSCYTRYYNPANPAIIRLITQSEMSLAKKEVHWNIIKARVNVIDSHN